MRNPENGRILGEEQAVSQAYGERALNIRPGLIVGPHDPTDRFTYWPVRIDKGAGISTILLLWPSNGGWPPEIDFSEDGGGNRSGSTATLHYGANNSQTQYSVTADFTQWHTMGVEWTAGQLKYTLDGTVWATVASPNVPSVPMELDAQAQAGTCGDQWAPCPDATTPAHVNMQIDWVAAYKQA